METFSTAQFNGRFDNPKSFINWRFPSLKDMYKWQTNGQERPTIPGAEELEKTLPVRRPVFDFAQKISAIWMGHATVFVHLEGFNFITDPVWAERVSPFSFAGPLRYRPPPCQIAELPKMDFGVISHNHYDHMDTQAIKALSQKFPEMKWFVPKGLKKSMTKCANGNEVHEMAWGENFTMSKDGKEIQVWCVPAQHWSTRCLFDRNKSLWSGWAVTGKEKRFYFAGDTGFCEEEFGRIGKILGPFDLAAIPIGAYSPRYIMKGQHIDPEEAVKVHQLVRAKQSIGIHWGTYPMGSSEPYLEPKTRLKEEVEKAGLSADAMITVEHGATWTENSS